MSMPGEAIAPTPWRSAGSALVVALLALIIANQEALGSWVQLWLYSGQGYGLLAAAASAWLLWRCLPQLATLTPRPDWRAWLVALPIAVAGGFAYLVDLRVLEFALFVGAAGALTWAILGRESARLLAFPTLFL